MSERRFPPSIERLKKARKQGKVVKSRIVIMLSGWVSVALFFYATLPWVRSGTLIHWLKFKVLTPEGAFAQALLVSVGFVATFLSVLTLGCVFSGALQTGGLLTFSQVLPDIQRLQPTRYVTKIREGGGDALLGLARVGILLGALAPVVVAFVLNAHTLVWAPDGWTVPVVSGLLLAMGARTLCVTSVYAVIAYGCVRWRYLREHRMSFEELREEHRESEGDPHFRAARRHEHQAMALAEIEKRVRNAKVLVMRRRP
jgi:flagellar biosynthesis protein FlhB